MATLSYYMLNGQGIHMVYVLINSMLSCERNSYFMLHEVLHLYLLKSLCT